MTNEDKNSAPVAAAPAAQAAIDLDMLARYEPIARAAHGGPIASMEADVEGEYVLLADVRAAVDDPMMVDHAEVSKNTLRAAIKAIKRAQQAEAAPAPTAEQIYQFSSLGEKNWSDCTKGFYDDCPQYNYHRRIVYAAPVGQAEAAAPVAWTKERVQALSRKIAEEVAKNASTVPQLTFPHIYLGLCETLLAAPAVALPAAGEDLLGELNAALEWIDEGRPNQAKESVREAIKYFKILTNSY